MSFTKPVTDVFTVTLQATGMKSANHKFVVQHAVHSSNRDLKQQRWRRQQQRQKAIGFMSKTTALHVHQAFQYISLTSTVQLRRKTSHYDVSWRAWTYYEKFSLLYLNMVNPLRIQLKETLHTFDELNGSKWTWKFERTQTHFLVMFSLSLSSLISD